MKLLALAVTTLTLAVPLLSQGRRAPFWSVGGYGNVLFPGTGHSPVTPPGGFTGPFFQGCPLPTPRGKWSHWKQNTIVPVPIYNDISAAGQDAGIDQGEPTVDPNTAPPARVDPGWSAHGGSMPRAMPPISLEEARVPIEVPPTFYLIALKDHSVIRALGYWRQGRTLYYVSAEYGMNQISISLIDRNLSEQLNHEHGNEFSLK